MTTHSITTTMSAEDEAAVRFIARSEASRLGHRRKREAYRQALVREALRQREVEAGRLEAMEGIRASFSRGMTNAQTIALDQVIEGIRDTVKAIDGLLLGDPVASA